MKKGCGIESGSGVPNKTKVAKISKAEVMKIAETKMPDLNAASIEAAYSMICGTARSMGITEEGKPSLLIQQKPLIWYKKQHLQNLMKL